MKIIILSPLVDTLFTNEMSSQLECLWEVIYIKQIKPFEEIPELYDESEKIIAIDPDFCDWTVTRDTIEKLENVKAICLQTTWFARIDTKAAAEKWIIVTNLRGYSREAVAEWAFMMALNVARKLPMVIKDWWKQDFSMHQWIELSWKTAWIIGLWDIGTHIAKLCKGFWMDVIYRSANSRNDDFDYKDLSEVMFTADVIFPTLAKNDETLSLLTDAHYKSMKNTSMLVSVVHGLCNHQLLLDLVREKKIYGYAFESGSEQITDYEGNVWAWPELARCTQDCLMRNAEHWISAIENAVEWVYDTRVN